MWTEAWTFAHHPHTSTPRRGVLTRVDVSIAQAVCLLLPECVEDIIIHIDASDCSDALRDVVAQGNDAVRIECNCDECRASQLCVCVNAERFDMHMASGTLAVEEALILLARSVWRDSRIPRRKGGGGGDDDDTMEEDPPQTCAVWREREYPLFPHQRQTVAWMRRAESTTPNTLRYPGHLRVTDKWLLDTEGECFTTDESPREALLAGGICADGMGSGKTAVALRLLAETATIVADATSDAATSDATLFIVPLNLAAQWKAEVDKFLVVDGSSPLRVRWMTQASHVRGTTLQELVDAHAVITTFHFLRASRGAYAEMLDAALGSRARAGRAAFSAWARRPGRLDPVLEAVHWKRIVVDELHETLENVRDLRQLRLFRTRMLWGLTATPVLDTDATQQLYVLLEREKPHHPNLLAALVAAAVRSHTPREHDGPGATEELRWVRLTAEEHLRLREAGEPPSVAREVREGTCPALDGELEQGALLSEELARRRARELAERRARVEAHERSVCILERAEVEFEDALARLEERCARGDDMAHVHAEVARASCDAHARDLVAARARRDAERMALQRRERAEHALAERLALLRTTPPCTQCGARRDVLAECGQLLCSKCEWVAGGAVARVDTLCGAGTKMHEIGTLLAGLETHAAVVLYVQWKSMMRDVKALLGALGVHVLLLDGNASQRANTLHEFLGGGVLQLCLEEGFAGLHLPHVQHVVFAHAIVADRERVARLERQAIARCVRVGQRNRVCVHSFVVTDGEEARLWHRTHD